MSPSECPAPSHTDAAPAVCEACSMELEKELPSTLSSPTVRKDVRAYEHNRQRARRAADRETTKSRKEKGWTMCRGAVYDKSKCSCCQSDKGKKHRAKDVKGLLDADEVGELGDAGDRPRTETGAIRGPRKSKEVSLSDLVTTTKPRKGKEGDYEVIPHVRSVIVLDDGLSSSDEQPEEPWEHIYGEGEEQKLSSPSYAEIVGIAK